MTLDTIYLDFTSPLHIGNHKPEGYEKSEVFLRSDTLIAAVMQAWSLIGREDWIEDYIQHPSFTVTSAFPFTKMEGRVRHFFPRPQLEWNLTQYDPKLSKRIKKAKWLDQNYFEKIIHHRSFDLASRPDDLQEGFLSINKVGVIQQKEMQDRVAVARDGLSDARPFTMERIRFSRDCGLYFIVKGEMERLIEALKVLQYEGIGTDRNVGNGQFEYSIGTLDLNIPVDAKYAMNLGLYCPDSQELEKYSPISFGLIKRGGWITSTEGTGLRKFSVNMFQEGSVFKEYSEILGRHDIDLSPSALNHPVYRSGRSLFIPVKNEDQ